MTGRRTERSTAWDDGGARCDWSGTALGAHYDVAVVGAGFAGLATALELAEAGCSVAVLEARDIGAGASGRTTAKASLLQGTRLSELTARHSADLVSQYVAGNRAGQEWLGDWAVRLGVEVQRRAAVTFAAAEEQLEPAEREHEACAVAGLPVRWRDGGDEPFPILGATVLEGQLQLDPRQMLDALAAHLADTGVTVRTGARVVEVHDEGDDVVSTAGTLRADHVVLATGSPILDRGVHFARLEAHRSYLTAFAPVQPAPRDMYISAGFPVRSLRTAPGPYGDLLLVGGNGHVVGRADSEAARVGDLVDWVQRHFPEAELRHQWSAQDFHAFGGLPHAGPLTPTSDRILVATGFAKWGLTNGVAAAAVLAAQLTGSDAPDWAEAFRSWSTHELAGAGPALRAGAEVAATMVRDQVAATGVAGDTPPAEGCGTVTREPVAPVATSTVDGATCAVRATCTHQGGLVRWNDFERSWDCPLHGSRFAPDGSVLEGPARSPLAPVAEGGAV